MPGFFRGDMGSKKLTNLVIMGVMAFALILAIQGVLGLVEKFKAMSRQVRVCRRRWYRCSLLSTKSCPEA